MPKISVLGLIKIILPLALGVYLIWYFFSSMSDKSLGIFYKALQEANYFWILLSLALSFAAFALRAYRWKYVLEPMGYTTKFWNRYHALMIGYLINLTIPRAGEVSRAGMLYRSDGVPFSRSFGTIIAERAVDLVMLVSVASITAYIGYDDFQEIFRQIKEMGTGKAAEGGFPWKIVIYCIIGAGILSLALIMILSIKWRTKLTGFAKDVFAGLLSIFKSRNPWAYIGQTLLIWILYISYFAIPFLSLEETSDFPLDGIMLAFIAGSLGITFTNGGIGSFPLLVGLVVGFFLGNKNQDSLAVGNALGMIIWVSQTLMLILLGLLSLALLPKNYNKENVETGIPEREDR